MRAKYPNTNLGWHKYYVNRFNRNQHPDAAYLACLYLFFHLAKDTPTATGNVPNTRPRCCRHTSGTTTPVSSASWKTLGSSSRLSSTTSTDQETRNTQ